MSNTILAELTDLNKRRLRIMAMDRDKTLKQLVSEIVTNEVLKYWDENTKNNK